MTRTALYRHFDADGSLLYVGVSSSTQERLYHHNCQSGWASEIASITLEHFDNRKEAIAAERVAIATESPRHNTAWKAAPEKADVNAIVAILTVDAMCDALGVGRHAVRYTRSAGSFPGNWYGTLLPMCKSAGIPCPLSAFNWKATAKQVSTDKPKLQGDAA
jgi:predicted GIY-YIG superfamily endonuclease